MNPYQKKFIEQWYWNAVFSQRYTGSSNERVIEDSNYLILIAKNKKIPSASFFNKLCKAQILQSEDVYAYDRKANAIYKGILNLINFCNKGLINWNNDSKLSLNSSLEDHHIFPKNYLSKILQNDADKDLIDCVANRTLVPKLQNIKISNQKPSDYLNQIKTINPQLENSLANHLITSDLLKGEFDLEFRFFLEFRASAIFDLIRATIIASKESFKEEYYEELKYDEGKNINIFSYYRGTRIDATFNPSSCKVFYKGSLFDNPSLAAQTAKKDMGVVENNTENGWTFWKYLDEEGIDRKIKNLKHQS